MTELEYIDAVLSGEILTGPHVIEACNRHLRDLKRDDLLWDDRAAERAVGFFSEVLILSAGEWEGKPFILLPWQEFIVRSIHGWRLLDGRRRFRRAYIETGKGSGKTPLASGLGIYAICADDEARAEGFVLARTADQALVTFRSATAMVEQSPALSSRLTVRGGKEAPYNIGFHEKASFLRRVSSDKQGKGKSGPIPHINICDEYHEHETSAMLEFYDAGTKNRRHPLTLIITNAGTAKQTPCGQEHDFAIRVSKGSTLDDSYFSYVCALGKDDDPFEDEECWIKTNPSLPDVPGYDYIRDQVRKARGMPSKKALVGRLNFCIWTGVESPWIDKGLWIKIERPELPEIDSRTPCYGAVDLARIIDLTAMALVWDLGEDSHPQFMSRLGIWTPKDTLQERSDAEGVPYVEWVEQGHMNAVIGKTLNYTVIAEFVGDAMARFNLKGIAYDPHKMDLLEEKLEEQGIETTRDYRLEGLFLAPHPQGFIAGSRADKTKLRNEGKVPLWMPRSIDMLEESILEGNLNVKYNPVLRWGALAAVIIPDASLNRRFSKNKSEHTKIDSIVSLAMGMGFASAAIPELAEKDSSDYILKELYG